MFAPDHMILLALVLLVALVVFGPKRLPELGHSVGRAITEFKSASNKAVSEFNSTSVEIKKAVSVAPNGDEQTVVATQTKTETVPAVEAAAGNGLAS